MRVNKAGVDCYRDTLRAPPEGYDRKKRHQPASDGQPIRSGADQIERLRGRNLEVERIEFVTMVQQGGRVLGGAMTDVPRRPECCRSPTRAP